mgnify:CR=1 FL=1
MLYHISYHHKENSSLFQTLCNQVVITQVKRRFCKSFLYPNVHSIASKVDIFTSFLNIAIFSSLKLNYLKAYIFHTIIFFFSLYIFIVLPNLLPSILATSSIQTLLFHQKLFLSIILILFTSKK